MIADPLISVAFSGHRTYRGDAAGALRRTLEELYARGFRTFLSDMAVGFDLAAAEAVLELRGGDTDPAYAGTADLYYSPAGRIELDYFGVWRMEDDCLYLKLSADSGDEIDASFPILISPSGEDLYFQRSRTGAGIPFLPDGMDSVGLLLYTG